MGVCVYGESLFVQKMTFYEHGGGQASGTRLSSFSAHTY